MNKLPALVLILSCVILFSTCSGKSADVQLEPTLSEHTSDDTAGPAYKKLTAEEAMDMMSELEEYILLDVRTEDEFKEQRIDGAVLIPDYEISSRAALELTDKDAIIFIYCRSGRRSANAANELIDMGYKNVYDFGGIIDWPYDTVSG